MRVAEVAGRTRRAIARASRAAISRRAIPAWVAAATITALLVAAIASGALKTDEVEPTPLAAGEEVRMPLYSVTVLDAQLTDEVEDQSLSADAGETLVLVSMRLENLSDRPIGVGRSADQVASRLIHVGDSLLTLTGVPSADSVDVWRDDGSAGSVILQPDVPSEVTIAWTAPEDAFADGLVGLDVYDAVETRGRIILSADQISWQRGEFTARIIVDTETGG